MNPKGTILLTGASGFIATNFLRQIKSMISAAGKSIAVFTSSESIPGYRCVRHNGYQTTKSSFHDAGVHEIDTVIHLGAYIPKSTQDSNNIEQCSSNITNTLHLLSQLPSLPRRFIFASTVDVYAPSTMPICETSCERPNSLYGASKLYCERIVEAWCQKNGVIPQILRIGHLYGRGEAAYKKLIPETIRRLLKGERPIIYSDGSERRSLLHVTDCVRAIIASVNLGEYSGPINVASNQAYTVKQIVDKLVAISGQCLAPDIRGSSKLGDDFTFDSDRMKNILVSETMPIDVGLLDEYEYFREIGA